MAKVLFILQSAPMHISVENKGVGITLKGCIMLPVAASKGVLEVKQRVLVVGDFR